MCLDPRTCRADRSAVCRHQSATVNSRAMIRIGFAVKTAAKRCKPASRWAVAHHGSAARQPIGPAYQRWHRQPALRTKCGHSGASPCQPSGRTSPICYLLSAICYAGRASDEAGQSHFSPRLSSVSVSLSRILICRDKSQRTPNISIVARMARFPKVYLLEP